MMEMAQTLNITEVAVSDLVLGWRDRVDSALLGNIMPGGLPEPM